MRLRSRHRALLLLLRSPSKRTFQILGVPTVKGVVEVVTQEMRHRKLREFHYNRYSALNTWWALAGPLALFVAISREKPRTFL